MRACFFIAFGCCAFLSACSPTLLGECVRDQDCAAFSETTCQKGICVHTFADAGDAGPITHRDGGPVNADGGPTNVDGGPTQIDAGPAGCQQNGDCPPLQVCQQNQCVNSGCSSDGDCASDPARHYCDPANRSCVACLADHQCPAGDHCTNHDCVPSGIGQPCPASGFCGQGLTCVQDQQQPTCRQSCELSAAAPRCQGGTYCGIASATNGQMVVGACLPSNQQGLEGMGCMSSDECQVNLACTQGACRRLCDPNRSTAACPTPSACAAAMAVDASGQAVQYGGCIPPVKTCMSTADCARGQVCAATPTASGGLANECVASTGSTLPGDYCGQGSDCRSGQCIGVAPNSAPGNVAGYCEGGCSKDSDCATPKHGLPGACELVAVTWTDSQGNDHSTDLNSCVAQCRSETDCAGSTSCIPVQNVEGTAWVTRCETIQNANFKKLGGADCYTGAECTTGICHHFTTATGGTSFAGICIGVCDPQSGTTDCTQQQPVECSSAGELLPLPSGALADLHVCWGAQCDPSNPCPFGHICAADPNPAQPSATVMHCRPQ
jgi:hypothetical protein